MEREDDGGVWEDGVADEGGLIFQLLGREERRKALL
jgi:hypothetical protein